MSTKVIRACVLSDKKEKKKKIIFRMWHFMTINLKKSSEKGIQFLWES